MAKPPKDILARATAKVKIEAIVPHNRPRRLAKELIAQYTNGGEDLIRFMLNVMEGQIPGMTAATRMDACQWLATHIFGKPTETSVQLSMPVDGATLPNLSDADLEQLARGLLVGDEPQPELPAGEEQSDEEPK